MTTEIVLRFPWGRYHGTPWGRHVNEGVVDWPPSTWRLLRALYATWQFRAEHLDASVVEALLGKLAGPPSYELPPYTTAATRHYMPGKDFRAGVLLRDGKGKALPADLDLAVDASVVVAPDAEVRMRWDVDLGSDEYDALSVLLEQLTYLGRAESLCDARISDPAKMGGPLAVVALNDDVGDSAIEVLVPAAPLDLSALTASTTRVRASDRRRLPAGARLVRYTRPEVEVRTPPRQVVAYEPVQAVRWSLAGRALPSRHAAVAVGTRLRQGAMKVAGTDDRPVPPVLHGKYEDTPEGAPLHGHGHAHWLSFGDVDGRQLHTVVAWAPNGFDADVLADLAQVDAVFSTGIPDFAPQRLGLEGWGAIDQVAPELVGPSRVWSSHTPFAPNGHRKKEPDDKAYLRAAIGRELAWRGLPRPVDIEIDHGPWGAYRTHRPDKERLRHSRRVWGLRIEFEEAVEGPLVLGALSHFGLGLFLSEP